MAKSKEALSAERTAFHSMEGVLFALMMGAREVMAALELGEEDLALAKITALEKKIQREKDALTQKVVDLQDQISGRSVLPKNRYWSEKLGRYVSVPKD